MDPESNPLNEESYLLVRSYMLIRHFMVGLSILVLLSGCSSLFNLMSDIKKTDSLYQEFTISTPNSIEEKRYLVLQLATLEKSGILTGHSIINDSKALFSISHSMWLSSKTIT